MESLIITPSSTDKNDIATAFPNLVISIVSSACTFIASLSSSSSSAVAISIGIGIF